MHTRKNLLAACVSVSVAAIWLIGASAPVALGQCDPIWSSQFAGNSNRLIAAVNALAYFDDDSNGPREPAIYAAGDFTFAGAATLNHVARRDGDWWTPLGAGLNGPVHALLAVESGHPGVPRGLYAGGDFSTAGSDPAVFIARWDGAAWHALGTGPAALVLSLAHFDEDGDGPNPPTLFAGTTTGVSRWNGTNWIEFDAGEVSPGTGPVYALSAFDEDGNGPNPARLFAGGRFFSINGVLATNIARWDGVAWTPVGSGIGQATSSNYVASLATHDDPEVGEYLVAGGFFHSAGGQLAYKIARWNGLEWSGFGDEPFFVTEVELVRSIDPDDEGPQPAVLYAFNPTFQTLFRWTGSQFLRAVAGGFSQLNDLIAVDQTGDGLRDLVLGGYFAVSAAPALFDTNFAVWDGSAWVPQRAETGLVRTPVNALLTADLDGPGPQPMTLFQSGSLTTMPFAALTRFDGSRWSDISFSLFNTGVTAMTTFDPDGAGPLGTLLVIGGAEGGHSNAPGVAAWDGSSWTPLTMFESARINALAAYDVAGTPRLFAATEYDVRMWTGSAWENSGGMLGNVTSLFTFDRDGDGPLARVLVATGYIPITSFGPAHAARFNGTAWSSFGSQINGAVDASVAVPQSSAPGAAQTLYAFAPIAGAPEPGSTYLLRWNPPAWEIAVPTPVGRTHCATAYNAAGTMTILRGTDSAIEVLAGASFSELPGGSATGNAVRALAIAPAGSLGSSSASLFAGGEFFYVGDVSSRYLAWHRGPEATVVQQPRADEFVAAGRAARFIVVGDGVEPLSYQWRRNGAVLTDDGRISGSSTPQLTIDPVQFGDEGDFDAVVSNDCGESTSDAAHLIVTGGDCPADIDGDRVVALQDLAHLLARFGDSINVYGNQDINSDGQVDLQDLALLLAAFGTDCP